LAQAGIQLLSSQDRHKDKVTKEQEYKNIKKGEKGNEVLKQIVQ
jgi:hypothetical protein